MADKRNITIHYQNTPMDYVLAHRAFYNSTTRGKANKVIALIVLIEGLWLLYGHELLWGILLIALAPIVWFSAVTGVRLFLFTKSNPKSLRPVDAVFNDSGVRMTGPSLDSSVGWKYWNKSFESKRAFILFFGKGRFHVFPKRAFTGEADITRFRSLVKRKIGKI